jgi:Protein of unknown function (Hypoth_ymh)
MSFLRGLPGTRKVTLIKGDGTAAEQRLEIQGQIQAHKGFFSLQVPIQEGDVVEEPDPRPGMNAIRRTAGRVDLYQGHGAMSHIEVTWGEPPRPARQPPAVLAIGTLHERVVKAAGALYADGHIAQAVFEAFKAVEVRIRDISAVDETGVRLIGQVFGGNAPARSLTKRTGRLGIAGRATAEILASCPAPAPGVANDPGSGGPARVTAPGGLFTALRMEPCVETGPFRFIQAQR